MSNLKFDLVEIVKIIQKNSKLVFSLTIGAFILGALIYIIKPGTYQGKAEFYITNPQFADRKNLFRGEIANYVEYFGNENIVDKAMVIAESDLVALKVAEKLNLYQHYNLDSSKAKDRHEMLERFRSERHLTRTEYYTIEVLFTDGDPVMAAKITDAIIDESNKHFNDYFKNLRANAASVLKEKKDEIDREIQIYTDSLVGLRNRYGIYDLLSPNRKTIAQSNIAAGGAEKSRGIEEIQNIESIKDQLVMDRANYISILNETTTGIGAEDISILNRVSYSLIPFEKHGLGWFLTGVLAAVAAFFFSTLYVLLKTYYKAYITDSNDN